MKYLILKAGIIFLKMIYMPLSLLKVQKKITYISRQSDNEPLDFAILRSEVNRRDVSYKNIVLARKISGGNKSAITYPLHMIRQMYHLATSRFVIVDGYCIVVSLLPHKEETKVIQIWHASSAIKKFGYQTLDMPSGSSRRMAEIMRMHQNYDYVFASSKETAKHFCQGFNVTEDKIKYIGLPHFSTLKDFVNEEKMEAAYPELKEKQNVLYMPTFRKGKNVELQSLIDEFDFDKYNLIARLHPLDGASKDDSRVIFDSVFSTYDWINKADVIIADYSSLIVECAWLKKKMFFYLYDYEEYSKDPGVNIDYVEEGLMPISFKNAADFKTMLETEYPWETINRFASKYIEITAEDSVDDFVNLLLE